MKFKKLGFGSSLVFSLIFLLSSPSFADKASVAIEAPPNVAKGSEITIRITVTHSSNSARHYVEWTKVWVNNQEIAKWEYTPSNLPEGVPFTREIKYKVEENVEVKAEASCNVHGSKGPATFKITLK
jgi:desulfoferrodoxin (superoxide reductase-like protein)